MNSTAPNADTQSKVAPAKCPTPVGEHPSCPPTCYITCHESHWHPMKRKHELMDCPGVLASIADLYE